MDVWDFRFITGEQQTSLLIEHILDTKVIQSDDLKMYYTNDKLMRRRNIIVVISRENFTKHCRKKSFFIQSTLLFDFEMKYDLHMCIYSFIIVIVLNRDAYKSNIL